MQATIANYILVPMGAYPGHYGMCTNAHYIGTPTTKKWVKRFLQVGNPNLSLLWAQVAMSGINAIIFCMLFSLWMQLSVIDSIWTKKPWRIWVKWWWRDGANVVLSQKIQPYDKRDETLSQDWRTDRCTCLLCSEVYIKHRLVWCGYLYHHHNIIIVLYII